jgi:hypothetical protein
VRRRANCSRATIPRLPPGNKIERTVRKAYPNTGVGASACRAALLPEKAAELVCLKASTACKGITLISYQKLAEVNAASATEAMKEPRWSLKAWPVWRWDMEMRRVVRDDRNEWFIIVDGGCGNG